ncbi:uncharacterized protein LOC135397525 isoform X2 [Ornithodoros turicata]|uniref:uncharacterized protein LOC135397525 isoform X2 n=1 Tax=Ornithodoros turicata TaxID=34597 RepID=UPI00313A36D6
MKDFVRALALLVVMCTGQVPELRKTTEGGPTQEGRNGSTNMSFGSSCSRDQDCPATLACARNECECAHQTPVLIHGLEGSSKCVKARSMNEVCSDDLECSFNKSNLICISSICLCPAPYVLTEKNLCKAQRPSKGGIMFSLVPTVVLVFTLLVLGASYTYQRIVRCREEKDTEICSDIDRTSAATPVQQSCRTASVPLLASTIGSNRPARYILRSECRETPTGKNLTNAEKAPSFKNTVDHRNALFKVVSRCKTPTVCVIHSGQGTSEGSTGGTIQPGREDEILNSFSGDEAFTLEPSEDSFMREARKCIEKLSKRRPSSEMTCLDEHHKIPTDSRSPSLAAVHSAQRFSRSRQKVYFCSTQSNMEPDAVEGSQDAKRSVGSSSGDVSPREYHKSLEFTRPDAEKTSQSETNQLVSKSQVEELKRKFERVKSLASRGRHMQDMAERLSLLEEEIKSLTIANTHDEEVTEMIGTTLPNYSCENKETGQPCSRESHRKTFTEDLLTTQQKGLHENNLATWFSAVLATNATTSVTPSSATMQSPGNKFLTSSVEELNILDNPFCDPNEPFTPSLSTSLSFMSTESSLTEVAPTFDIGSLSLPLFERLATGDNRREFGIDAIAKPIGVSDANTQTRLMTSSGGRVTRQRSDVLRLVAMGNQHYLRERRSRSPTRLHYVAKHTTSQTVVGGLLAIEEVDEGSSRNVSVAEAFQHNETEFFLAKRDTHHEESNEPANPPEQRKVTGLIENCKIPEKEPDNVGIVSGSTCQESNETPSPPSVLLALKSSSESTAAKRHYISCSPPVAGHCFESIYNAILQSQSTRTTDQNATNQSESIVSGRGPVTPTGLDRQEICHPIEEPFLRQNLVTPEEDMDKPQGMKHSKRDTHRLDGPSISDDARSPIPFMEESPLFYSFEETDSECSFLPVDRS